jgi:hypothetical protein
LLMATILSITVEIDKPRRRRLDARFVAEDG